MKFQFIRSSHTTRQLVGVCISNKIAFDVKPSGIGAFTITVDQKDVDTILIGLSKIQEHEGVRP